MTNSNKAIILAIEHDPVIDKLSTTEKVNEYSHPECFHVCTSNCRKKGCNCGCGEFHGKLTLAEYQEAVSDLNAELAGAEVDSF